MLEHARRIRLVRGQLSCQQGVFTMRRNHIIVALVAVAFVAAATFGFTELAQAWDGYPFTG